MKIKGKKRGRELMTHKHPGKLMCNIYHWTRQHFNYGLKVFNERTKERKHFSVWERSPCLWMRTINWLAFSESSCYARFNLTYYSETQAACLICLASKRNTLVSGKEDARCWTRQGEIKHGRSKSSLNTTWSMIQRWKLGSGESNFISQLLPRCSCTGIEIINILIIAIQ